MVPAKRYVERLSRRIPLLAAAGSVAQGDFNVWSDIDLVVVARDLPSIPLERALLLLEDAPPELQPVGFTPAEPTAAWSARSRLVREGTEGGVVLAGDAVFRALPRAPRRVR